MVYNKIIANNQTVLDISDDTADSDKVLRGISFHKNSGEKANGTIETYAGDTNVTENKVLPTAGTYLNSDITVNVSGGSSAVSPEYVSFADYSGTTLDLSWLDTKNIISMNGMFSNCTSLTSLNLSSFNTSNVTEMNYMFRECGSLTSLDLSNFDTSKVTSMREMFSRCSSLTSLDLSSFNTSKVIGMNEMFSNCNRLTSLDLSNFDTSNVTSMDNMFRDCNELTHLDLSGFDTSIVENMMFMFSGCTLLTYLDISSFDFANVMHSDMMFEGVPDNCEILVKDEKVKDRITSNFPNLTNVEIKAKQKRE